MTFKLYFTEHHSDLDFWVEQGNLLLSVDDEGWGEFEHREIFEAPTIDHAKDQVFALEQMSYNSSGVFNVYKDSELVFTEEDC